MRPFLLAVFIFLGSLLSGVHPALGFGGTGVDGAFSPVTNIEFDAGGLSILEKNFTSINIPQGVNVSLVNPHPNGTIMVIKSQGDVAIDGVIDLAVIGARGGQGGARVNEPDTNGNNGTSGMTCTGAGDGLAHGGMKGLGGEHNSNGVAGGSGGGGGGHMVAGADGRNSAAVSPAHPALGGKGGPAIQSFANLVTLDGTPIPIACGSGGGGAGSGGKAGNNGESGGGGRGGRGGGALYMEVGGNFTFTGTITVAGEKGSGGQPSEAQLLGAGGGGGGGSGGQIYILYSGTQRDEGVKIINGGLAGGGGVDNGNGGGGGSGGPGAEGNVLIAKHVIPLVVTVNGGSSTCTQDSGGSTTCTIVGTGQGRTYILILPAGTTPAPGQSSVVVEVKDQAPTRPAIHVQATLPSGQTKTMTMPRPSGRSGERLCVKDIAGSSEAFLETGRNCPVATGEGTITLLGGSGSFDFTLSDSTTRHVDYDSAQITVSGLVNTLLEFVGDEDGDNVLDDEDQCPGVVGQPSFNGCPFGDKNTVTLHIIDQAKRGDCGGAGSCKKPIVGAEVRIFDRNDSSFQAVWTKNPAGIRYADVFERGVGRISRCVTSTDGVCIAGEANMGDYLVIVKFIESETGKKVYSGLPKGPEDFVNGLASKEFQVNKVIGKDGSIQIKSDSKTVIAAGERTTNKIFAVVSGTGAKLNHGGSLWRLAQQLLGGSTSIRAVMSLARNLATDNGIVVPEWGLDRGLLKATMLPIGLELNLGSRLQVTVSQ